MAQFDVHRNPGRQRQSIPFVVVLQSKVFEDYARRVVAPLVRRDRLQNVHHPRFNPGFRIEDIDVVLHPLEIVSVPANSLDRPVASLAGQSQQIIDALDELFSRAYG